MSQTVCLRLCLLLSCLPVVSRSAERWSQLALGMSPEDTIAAIGQPLLRNFGRGLEIWIYDNNAEVLFLGNVIGWSTPATTDAPAKTADVWQANQGKDDYRAVLLMLPPPKEKPKPIPFRTKNQRPSGWRPPLRYMR